MRIGATICSVFMLLGALSGAARGEVGQLRVLALFPGKAMVEVDGKRRVLKTGVAAEGGIRLISATAKEAVIEVNGERERFRVGSYVGTRFSQREAKEAKIWRDRQGAYRTVGTINGRMADMLIDTGATSVAMSEKEARRLGIPYRLKGEPTGVRTAAGPARAYALKLDQVRVGEIALNGVDAVVIEGDSPTHVLLGMSFLKRVVMENRGALLVLRSKF